jgi:hypothetical protein
MQLTAADVAELEQFVQRGQRLLERLRALAPAPAAQTPPPAAAPAPEPAQLPRPHKAVVRVKPRRPATVPCEGDNCNQILVVGRRGKLPRFCKPCQGRRGRKLSPAELEAARRRDESRRRIGATLALASRPGAPLVESRLLKRFDERRAGRR